MGPSTVEIAEAIANLAPSAGSTVVVGIDGCGGAGKSTLATKLAALLQNVQIIHTDDFASWDNPIDWWPRLMQEVLVPLSENSPARYQRYDWDERKLAEWHDVTASIVLLEGVSATREEFRPFLGLKLWVDCSRAKRLERGLERDGIEAEPLWKAWMAAEDQYCALQSPKEHADIVISTG